VIPDGERHEQLVHGILDGDGEQHGEELATAMGSSTEELTMATGSSTEELATVTGSNTGRNSHEE
jgi:hypothetical protein